MFLNEKAKVFGVSIIKIAEKEELSEEEFVSAIDAVKLIIRRNPVTSKCLKDME